MAWLPDGEKVLMIRFIRFDTTHIRDRRTDGRTDRQTPHDDIGRACIASRGENHPIVMKFCTQQQILNWMNVT